MARKHLLSRRQWLRPVRSWGPQSSIHTSVEMYTGKDYKTKKPYRTLDAEVGFRDCSNYVSFSLEASNERQHGLQRRAIVKLISELELVLEHWDSGKELIEEQGGWTG